MGIGQGSWQPQAGQDRTGWGQLAAWHRTRGSQQDTSEVGIQQPPAIQQHAGREPQGQARQAGEHRVPWGTGAGSCHPWPRHRAAVGRGQGAGEQAGRGQGAASPSRLRAAEAQSGCRQGAGGPGQGAGATERVRAGHGVTLEEGGDVPGGDAPLLHELSQGHLQEEDGDAAHEDDEQVGNEEDAWGRGQGTGSAAAVPPAPPFAPPFSAPPARTQRMAKASPRPPLAAL